MKTPLKQYWSLLANYLKPQWPRALLLAALMLTHIGLRLLNPQIMRFFIDTATSGGGLKSLINAALLFLGVAIASQGLAIVTTYLGESVAWTATNALRAELTRHCLHLDMSFHNEHTPGELIERIDGDVAQLSNFFSQLVALVLGNLLLLLGILMVLLLENWRVGIVFTLFAAISLLALNRVRDVAVPYQKAVRQANADLFGFLEEQLGGTEDIRSCGAVSFCLRELYRLQYAILRHDRKAQMMNLAIGLITGMLLTFANAIAVLAGYTLHQSGAITVGTAYLIIHYVNLLARPIHELAHHVESLQTIGASVERLTDLCRLETAIQDGPGAHIPSGPLSLTFDDVSFAYVEQEPVLRGLSFRLEPGKVLGLLGHTGSGKTTLARLIVRLYDSTTGRITLDGVDVRAAQLKALRQRVAVVTQDVQLYRATVRDNLTFFDRSISDEQIRKVIDQLGLADWYQSLPEGLDTRLETGRRSLSAGEAQLLAFTRIFLRDPGLVILDEASSRLDPATEQRIERAVDRLLQNRTAIVIAHRLDTVHRADEVMILEEGRVGEHGEREGLARNPTSRFYSLLQTGLEEVLA